MAALPAGMANANAFIGPVMPNITKQAGPGLGIVIPTALVATDCDIFGNLPTPSLGPPGGEPLPAVILYQITIRARILISGRVAGVSEETNFVTYVGDGAGDPFFWVEDQEAVDPAQDPDVYALNGFLYQQTAEIEAGDAPVMLIGVLREAGDTAIYTLDEWMVNYRRIL